MDANEVNMVAIGLEEIGADDFVEEGFFDGEMYIDQKRKTYENLNYKRFNIFNIFLALLSAASRAALSESNSRGVKGNLIVGDGLQNGGLLVIDKGGAKVLLNHREENPGDHAANETILQSLGIKELVPVSTDAEKQKMLDEPLLDCTDECAEDTPPKHSFNYRKD